MNRYEDEAYKALLARERYYEREVQKQLAEALDKIRGDMKRVYNSYARDGILSRADMARYNRYTSMENGILRSMNEATRANIQTIDRLRPEQYGESYFRNAWAIEQQGQISVNWGLVNRQAIVENLANDFYHIAKDRYGVEARLRIRQTLAQGITQGSSYQTMARQLKQAINVTNAQALRILRTEGQTAIMAGQEATYLRAANQGIEGKIIWDATLDTKTRDTHGAMDGKARKEDGTFEGPGGESARFPADPNLSAAERINCFPGNVVVDPANIERIYRQYYSGIIITICTARGIQLAVTSNHPILTQQGWIAANLIKQGTNIVSVNHGNSITPPAPNKKRKPPMIAQVFELGAVVGRIERVSGMDVDFHGDGRNSNIDVITIDSQLRDALNVFRQKESNKLGFPNADILERMLSSDRPVYQFVDFSFCTTNSIMSGKSYFESFSGRQLAHSYEHGFTPVAGGISNIGESTSNDLPGNIESNSKLFDRNTRFMEFDKVVSIDANEFSGHVYNLQTKDSIIIAGTNQQCNGIIAHNCRCTMRYEIEGFEPGLRRTRDGGVVPRQSYSKWKRERPTWE